MPAKESELKFDAYDGQLAGWLRFKRDLATCAVGVLEQSLRGMAAGRPVASAEMPRHLLRRNGPRKMASYRT